MKVPALICGSMLYVAFLDVAIALEHDVFSPPEPASTPLTGRQADDSPSVSPTPTMGPSSSISPTITTSPTKITSLTAPPTQTGSPTSLGMPSAAEPSLTMMPSLTTSPATTNTSSMSPTVTSQPTSMAGPTLQGAPSAGEPSRTMLPSLTTPPATTNTSSMPPTVAALPTSTTGPTGGNDPSPTTTDELGIQTPPDGSDCWGNLTDILMDQRKYSFRETTVKRTYIVCPDKLYRTGATDQDGVFDPTFHAIFGMRRNVEYRCGADGSSSNNCTIRGLESLGELVMVGVPDIFVSSCSQTDLPEDGICDFIIDNFTFRGFTLEATTISTIYGVAQVGKNVLFDDIVLQDATQFRHIHMSKYGLVNERRRLVDGTDVFDAWIPSEVADRWPWNFRVSDSVHHRLQEAGEEEDFTGINFSNEDLDLTISNSRFINNALRQCPRFVACAEENPAFNFLISSDKTYSPINIINCTFENNDFSSPVNPAPEGFYGYSHLFAVDWNSTVTDNVFINNTVTSSLIRVFDNTSDQTLTFANNYVDPSPVAAEFDADGIDCTFALIGGIIELEYATCVEADITDASPPPPPSLPENDQPTSAPSSGRLITPLSRSPMTYLPTDAPSLRPASDAPIRGIRYLFYLTAFGAFMLTKML